MSGAIPGWGGGGSAAPTNTGTGANHSNVEVFGADDGGTLRSLRTDATGHLQVVVDNPTDTSLLAADATVVAGNSKLDTISTGVTSVVVGLTPLSSIATNTSGIGNLAKDSTAVAGNVRLDTIASNVAGVSSGLAPLSTIASNTSGLALNSTAVASNVRLDTLVTQTVNLTNLYDLVAELHNNPNANPGQVGNPASSENEGSSLSIVTSTDEPLRGLINQLPASRGVKPATGSISTTLASDDVQVAALISAISTLTSRLPASVGQKTSAESLSVVIASDAAAASTVNISDGHGLALELRQKQLLAASGFVGGTGCVTYPFAVTFNNGVGWRIPGSGPVLTAPTTLATLFKPPTSGSAAVIWFVQSDSGSDIGRNVTFDVIMADGSRRLETVAMLAGNNVGGQAAYASLQMIPAPVWVNYVNAGSNEADLVPGAVMPLVGTLSLRISVDGAVTVMYQWVTNTDSTIDLLSQFNSPQWPVIAVPTGYTGYLRGLQYTGSDPANFVYWGVSVTPLASSSYRLSSRYLANGMTTSVDWRFPVPVPAGPLGPVAAGALIYFATGCTVAAPGRHHVSGQFVLVPN